MENITKKEEKKRIDADKRMKAIREKYKVEIEQEKEDSVTHHPSNAKNCPRCMDLWIARENKKPKTDYGKLTVNALRRMK